ncbi:hypothetical protein EV207_1703 [Scopulibacillus darangshiensis]|uniref:Secreted protein n=1 Tax=Scopulibacillus darangshiensis TaxID=442528 RepID=A0A4R2NC44_9BACL|nr:hypothetical protein EV207_1703 [Scopulibacillus darangshiensis]
MWFTSLLTFSMSSISLFNALICSRRCSFSAGSSLCSFDISWASCSSSCISSLSRSCSAVFAFRLKNKHPAFLHFKKTQGFCLHRKRKMDGCCRHFKKMAFVIKHIDSHLTPMNKSKKEHTSPVFLPKAETAKLAFHIQARRKTCVYFIGFV